MFLCASGSPLISRIFRVRCFLSSSKSTFWNISTIGSASMARLTRKALMDDIANTVIEDSEPERVAERAREIDQQRKRKAAAKVGKRQKGTKQPVVDEVIIVSDSEHTITRDTFPSAKRMEPRRTKNSGTIIHAVGGSAITSPLPQQHNSAARDPPHDELTSIRDVSSSHIKDPDSKQSKFDDNAPINLDEHITETAFPDSPVKKMDLSRFAFAQRPGQGMQSRLVQTKQASTLAQEALRPRRTAALDFPLTGFFTTQQLIFLSKCVVCDHAWTTRKSVPVKLQHMKSCAKKNTWKEEAVILAVTEVVNAMPALAGKERVKKGKMKATIGDEAPRTYLEDLVSETAPKKKKRRAQGTETVTVLKPQDAHTVILERAKAIFGNKTSLSTEGNQIEQAVFPQTQPFKPSKLGAAGPSNAHFGVLERGMLEDEDEDCPAFVAGKSIGTEHGDTPPSTQHFPPSVLGNRLEKRPVFLHENDEEADVSLLTQPSGKNGVTERYAKTPMTSILIGKNDDHSSKDRTLYPTLPHSTYNPARPCNPMISIRKPLLSTLPPRDPRAQSAPYSANDDHLYLPKDAHSKLADLERRLARICTKSTIEKRQIRNDPHTSPSSESENCARGRVPVVQDGIGTRLASKEKHIRNVSPSGSRSRSTSSHSKKAQKRRRWSSRSPHKHRSPKDTADNGHRCDNTTLNKDMHRVIIGDKELHMKILRYEPVHFNVFLEAASQHGMGGKGFGMKLRVFLDQQAINFYGDSALSTNRRRYK